MLILERRDFKVALIKNDMEVYMQWKDSAVLNCQWFALVFFFFLYHK